MEWVAFLVSFGASTIGAICGVGGGIVIKPVMDALGALSVAQVNFLAGCTVLAMTAYSVVRALAEKTMEGDLGRDVPLGVGAAIGGMAGKALLGALTTAVGRPELVGAVQAAVLAVVTLGTLLYTVFKNRITGYCVQGAVPCALIGLGLGVCSSFLGIGGGPINLVALYFFFSLDTKPAATSSLFIILLSQSAATLCTLASGAPDVPALVLVLMVAGGVIGGMVGRRVNRGLGGATVDKLFIGLMAVIIAICLGNLAKFAWL